MKAKMKVFPYMQQAPDGRVVDANYGMDLRDYFAAKAMQAFVNAWVINKDYPDMDSEVAMLSYKLADAMLKERE